MQAKIILGLVIFFIYMISLFIIFDAKTKYI